MSKTLRCPRCARQYVYDQWYDPNLPTQVTTIIVICPSCDDGDFHSETWLDEAGQKVSQEQP